MSKNIEMNYFNGSGYEQLYPRSKMSNISDWNSYVYSKDEINQFINKNGTVKFESDLLVNTEYYIDLGKPFYEYNYIAITGILSPGNVLYISITSKNHVSTSTSRVDIMKAHNSMNLYEGAIIFTSCLADADYGKEDDFNFYVPCFCYDFSTGHVICETQWLECANRNNVKKEDMTILNLENKIAEEAKHIKVIVY